MHKINQNMKNSSIFNPIKIISLLTKVHFTYALFPSYCKKSHNERMEQRFVFCIGSEVGGKGDALMYFCVK